MPRSGSTGEIQVRLRRCVRGDPTMGETNHPVHPRPNPCSRGPRSPGRPTPAPHPGDWGLRARGQARGGAGPSASGASLPLAPTPRGRRPARRPHARPPAAFQRPPAGPASSPNSPRPEAAPPPRDRRASAGRAAGSSVGLRAEEASSGRREARLRRRRAYEGRVLKLFRGALEQFQ